MADPTPRLYTLDDRPQTWPELLERNRAHWETYNPDGSLRVVLPVSCGECARGSHGNCTGDHSGYSHQTVCGCACRRAA